MDYWDQSVSPSQRVLLRAHAVQAVNSGEKKSHVAKRIGVTRQTLYAWVSRHRVGGAEALCAKPRGRTGRRAAESSREAQGVDAGAHGGLAGSDP